MIRLTRLNHAPLVLNSDLIEHIEMTPDTVVSLTNGQKLMVRETPEQVVERVIEFRREILSGTRSYTSQACPEYPTEIGHESVRLADHGE